MQGAPVATLLFAVSVNSHTRMAPGHASAPSWGDRPWKGCLKLLQHLRGHWSLTRTPVGHGAPRLGSRAGCLAIPSVADLANQPTHSSPAAAFVPWPRRQPRVRAAR